MLAQIKEETALHQAFKEYQKHQIEIRKHENAIKALKKEQEPFKTLIRSCVKCNNEALICAEFSAKWVHKDGFWTKPCSYVYINV